MSGSARRVIVFFAAVIVVGCSRGGAPGTVSERDESEPSEYRTAPAWELPDVDGNLIEFAEFAGQITIIDFWATWCAPCRKEIPELVEVYGKYRDRGVSIVGISLDQPGNPAIREFLDEFGVNYPVVIGNAEVMEAFGDVDGVPTTYVIDRNGRVIAKHLGYTNKATFEREIDTLLGLNGD